MKKIKAMACVLAVAMLAGIFAGCSKTTKISTDKFAKVCERLKLEEYDADDTPDEDAIEDGIYMIADEDMIEDQSDVLEDLLAETGLDDIIDVDDVKSMAIAAKCIGIDSFEDVEDPEDIEDVSIDGAFALQIELDDNYVEDVMDYIDDVLDTYDINTKDFTNKEYYVSKNDGFIRFHIDIAKFIKIILDNDDLMELVGLVFDEDDFADICNSLSGDLAISIEVNKTNIFVLAGGAFNTKPTVLNSFASAFGAASNPTKVPMNNKFVEELIDDAVDQFGSLANYYGGYDDYVYDYDYDDYDFDV